MSIPARDAIFTAIGDNASDERGTDPASIEREALALLANPDAMRPPRTAEDRVEAFMSRINGDRVAASATRIESLQSLPATVSALLAEHDSLPASCLQPTAALGALDWAGAGHEVGGTLDDGIAIGLALWGIAETGSLVVHSAADSPILLHFLPAISIVAVPADRLLWHLEDYPAAALAAGNAEPRNACLITGASGTTDIEGRLVTGAHGPGELHVVVFDRP